VAHSGRSTRAFAPGRCSSRALEHHRENRVPPWRATPGSPASTVSSGWTP
jgi:hypothetical protein